MSGEQLVSTVLTVTIISNIAKKFIVCFIIFVVLINTFGFFTLFMADK